LLAGEKENALQAYRQGCMWREAFALAKELGCDENAIQEMSGELRDELLERKLFKDAATVALDYGKNVKNAVELLAKGTHWGDAIRLAKEQRTNDLIESLIKPIALEAYQHMKDDIQDMCITFDKHVKRLKEVRIKKAQHKNAPVGPEDPSLANIDILSDTSSMATTLMSGTIRTRSSMMSNATTRTSRQRRKLERKKAAGKLEAFEDEFLIESLRKAIEKSNDLRPDLLALLRFTVEFGSFEDAKILQRLFKEFLQKAEEHMAEIFELNEPEVCSRFLIL
jgi:elongator complex protein 1